MTVWPDTDASGDPEVLGEPLPAPPPSQAPPRGGAGPRVDSVGVARRMRSLPHRLLAFTQSDGYPAILPVDVAGGSSSGLALRQPGGSQIPPGARRACLLGHSYQPHLIGLKTRQSTGWLEAADESDSATFAPHTEQGFAAPANKTLTLLINGLVAKVGLRRGRRAGSAALLNRSGERAGGATDAAGTG